MHIVFFIIGGVLFCYGLYSTLTSTPEKSTDNTITGQIVDTTFNSIRGAFKGFIGVVSILVGIIILLATYLIIY